MSDTVNTENKTELLENKILELLENMLSQLMKVPFYENLECAHVVLDYCKKISIKKIKVKNTIARIFKILEPFNDTLLNGDYKLLNTEETIEVLPGVNITKFLNYSVNKDGKKVEMDIDSKKILLNHLSLLKCYVNFALEQHTEKTREVYENRLLGLHKYEKLKTSSEINEAKLKIREKITPLVNSDSVPILNSLVDQIGSKLEDTDLNDTGDLRGFLDLAFDLANKNKEAFIKGKINVNELSKAATSVIKDMYSDSATKEELQKSLGIDPTELLQKFDNGNYEDVNKNIESMMKKFNTMKK